VDPTTAFLLPVLGIIVVLSARATIDYFVELAPGARRLMNGFAGVICLSLVVFLVLLAIALRQDPQACPWNGCS